MSRNGNHESMTCSVHKKKRNKFRKYSLVTLVTAFLCDMSRTGNQQSKYGIYM